MTLTLKIINQSPQDYKILEIGLFNIYLIVIYICVYMYSYIHVYIYTYTQIYVYVYISQLKE